MGRSSTRVFKKRKGQYHARKSDASETSAVENSSSDDIKMSASEVKIGSNPSFSMEEPSGSKNVILDLSILANVFHVAVKCLNCESTGLGLSIEEANCGVSVELRLKCSSCSYTHRFNSSKKQESTNLFEVNSRLVYAMRSIGRGAEATRMFCGLMNLPPPPAKFNKYNQVLLQAAKETCEDTMSAAVAEAVEANNGDRDLTVAVDGTWQKRGFSSKNGVVTVTSVANGKVLDVDILSKHCLCPDKKHHLPNCKGNFEGYSGKMEVDGAVAIFGRSEHKYSVRYTNYLGDGDSKAYDTIAKKNIYGAQCPVIKLECIGHVMKRMGSRLRRLKAKMRGQKLSDGKPLSGKNRLTEVEIDRLQTYYGLAIRRNFTSVENMKQAIWAIFLHKLSTDKTPQHGFCPSGPETWCKFKKAEQLGEPYHHKNSLPVAVVEAMRPTFKDLADRDLLSKCTHGLTQNPNESVNNVIWSRVPKKTFVHIETLSLGTYDAVSSFNVGNISKLQTLRRLGIEPGDYTMNAMEVLDRERLLKSRYASLQRSKEVRTEKRLKRKREDDDVKNNPDDMDYGAGLY